MFAKEGNRQPTEQKNLTSSAQHYQQIPSNTNQQNVSYPQQQLSSQQLQPAMIAPYIPVVRPQQFSNGQNYYLLPSDEIQKMLQQNALIIRKFMSDVKSGKQIDVTEYTGLHTSVYLLSLFTKQKNGSLAKSGIPVSTYQTLIKKMKQVQLEVQNKHCYYLFHYTFDFFIYLGTFPGKERSF